MRVVALKEVLKNRPTAASRALPGYKPIIANTLFQTQLTPTEEAIVHICFVCRLQEKLEKSSFPFIKRGSR